MWIRQANVRAASWVMNYSKWDKLYDSDEETHSVTKSQKKVLDANRVHAASLQKTSCDLTSALGSSSAAGSGRQVAAKGKNAPDALNVSKTDFLTQYSKAFNYNRPKKVVSTCAYDTAHDQHST